MTEKLIALPRPEASDLKRLQRYDTTERVRALVEMAIVRRLIMDVCLAGNTITVDDGEDFPVKDSTDVEEILEAAFAVDECWLQVYSGPEKCLGLIFLVFGNTGWDVICGYHVSLEPLLTGVNEYADQLSEWF